MAWARPGQGQAMSGSFGSAQVLSRPKPPQAKPKLGLLGQAGPEHHYLCTRIMLLVSLSFVMFIYTHAKSSLQWKVHVESCDGAYWDKVDVRLLFICNTADRMMWKIT
jgi:hypothetical protein